VSESDRVLKLDYRGAPQTVGVIREAALESQQHFPVRKLTEDICRDLRAKDYTSEALAIYHYVCKQTRYMRDPRTVELVRAPYVVVDDLQAGRRPQLDCDDMSALIAALLLSSGCQTQIVTVAFKNMFYQGQRQFSHVFAQGREPRTGQWITLDPVPVNISQMDRRIVAAKFWPVG
jgi:hypothetical protein